MKTLCKIILFIFIVKSECILAQDSYRKNERMFKTNKFDLFHMYATPTVNFKNNFDGIILGFEKVPDKRINSNRHKFSLENEQDFYNINYTKYWKNKAAKEDSKILKKRYKQLARWNKIILEDSKSMVLTHWLNSNKGQFTTKYNIYDNEYKETESYDLYKSTKLELDKIKGLIDSLSRTNQYTHILLLNTGWNNNQFQSVNRYNEWLKVINDAALEKGQKFNPFFIGVTWPSYWTSAKSDKAKAVIDLPNKANDADELGLTHINYLLWKILMPVAKEKKIPLVLIGHSLGARLITRASHSGIYFNEKIDTTQKIDLAIAFQGAYLLDRHTNDIINRKWYRKKTTGKGLYTTYNPWKLFAATTSKYDYAMNAAKITNLGIYMGNDESYNDPDYKNNSFKYLAVDNEGHLDLTNNEASLYLLNANSIIKELKSTSKLTGGAHFDVSNKECGRLIWQLMENIKD